MVHSRLALTWFDFIDPNVLDYAVTCPYYNILHFRFLISIPDISMAAFLKKDILSNLLKGYFSRMIRRGRIKGCRTPWHTPID